MTIYMSVYAQADEVGRELFNSPAALAQAVGAGREFLGDEDNMAAFARELAEELSEEDAEWLVELVGKTIAAQEQR